MSLTLGRPVVRIPRRPGVLIAIAVAIGISLVVTVDVINTLNLF